MIAAPSPCDPAHGDQEPVAAGKSAGKGRRGEDREADREDAPASEKIGGSAAEEQEASERDPVSGHHPLQVRLREVELLADRRQRDVDDRDVGDGHEECDGE